MRNDSRVLHSAERALWKAAALGLFASDEIKSREKNTVPVINLHHARIIALLPLVSEAPNGSKEI